MAENYNSNLSNNESNNTVNSNEEKSHLPGCSCCKPNRRGFIKQLGAVGLGLGAAPSLVHGLSSLDPSAGNTNQSLSVSPGIPMDASHAPSDESVLASIKKSSTLKSGKAQHFTLLHTADIHGQLYVHDEFFLENGKPVYKRRGGMAHLKTMINEIRNENPGNTLVIDGGDCFQGSGVAALSQGKAIVPLINNIGYDLMLPGNWEVVYGKDLMMRDLGGYHAAKVCANMYHDVPSSDNKDSLYPPYWTTRVAGVKIGFVGYNDPLTPKRQSPAYSYGIKFTDPAENAQKLIKYLRDYEQCSMVFLVTHMGLAQQVDLSNKPYVEGADYILGADTHERVRKPIEGKYSKVTEPGAFASFLGKLDIVVENGIVKEHHYELMDVDPTRYAADAEMEVLVEQVRTPYKKQLDTVIGVTKTPLVRYYVLETPMDNMITDALMWKLKPDIALSNGFRFCPPLLPDPKTGKAEITEEYLWSMLPVDSEAKKAMVSGKQLWDWLEKELENVFAVDPAKRFGGWVVRFKGMEVNFTSAKPKGSRINWIKVKGKKLDLQKLYSIVACEREGDPVDTLCRLEKVQNPQKLNVTLHQIMKDYLQVNSPVSPKIEGRITCTDKPITLLSQLEGYDYDFR